MCRDMLEDLGRVHRVTLTDNADSVALLLSKVLHWPPAVLLLGAASQGHACCRAMSKLLSQVW